MHKECDTWRSSNTLLRSRKLTMSCNSLLELTDHCRFQVVQHCEGLSRCIEFLFMSRTVYSRFMIQHSSSAESANILCFIDGNHTSCVVLRISLLLRDLKIRQISGSQQLPDDLNYSLHQARTKTGSTPSWIVISPILCRHAHAWGEHALRSGNT